MTDSTDSQSAPSDLDGDTVCDTLDDDIDGDGIPNDEEANSGDHIGDGDEQTDTIILILTVTEFVMAQAVQMKQFVLLVLMLSRTILLHRLIQTATECLMN